MSQAPDDLRARVEAIRAKMTGGAAPAAPAAPAADAAAAPAAAPAAAAAGGDMAARVAAIKAKMAGGAAPAPAAAAAKPAAAAAAAPAAAPAAAEADVAARVAALKAKMEAGKGAAATARPGAAATSGSATVAAPAKPAPAKAPAGKPIWPVQPIDRTSFGEERLYAPGSLARWFSLGGVLLVVSVVLMLRHDWVRDWKTFQSNFREIRIQRGQEAVKAADSAIDKSQLAQVEAEVATAGTEVAARSADLAKLQAEWEMLDGELFRAEQDFKFKKSEFDALRYSFEELRLKSGGKPEVLAASDAQMTGMKGDLDRLQGVYDGLFAQREAKKAAMDAMTGRETAAKKALAALTEQRDLAAARLERIDHNLFNDLIRNAPIADMLAPTLKIDQIVLERLKDNYNFMYVGKIDRCTTCHVGIDDPALTGPDWDKPGQRVYMAHPRLDLFVSDNSPHPKGEFGCTVCHQGRGQAVEFPRTFHVPSADKFETEEQKKERWVADYGYDEHRHYWDFPMVPADKMYSSCFQCHQETDRLPGVPEYNDSRALVEDLGCYGCHKIEGLQHMRKPGPDLTNIASKTTEDWARKWVEAPKAFRPTTRMPHFFNQSNTGGKTDVVIEGHLDEVRDDRHPWNNDKDRWVDDYRARNQVEVRAIVAYVFGLSREAQAKTGYKPLDPPKTGDAGRGKELFVERGCLGCHSMARDDLVEATHGPDLSAVGSKVNGAWLYDWLKNPRKYFPTTVMPDLRLSDEEAEDIAAYLLTGRDTKWEALPQPTADEKILDSIAVEYLSAAAGEELGKADLARMRGQGGTGVVERFVGGKLFSRYGCSGCHVAPGHENDTGVGTELTKEGLKELSKFDFGFEADVHNPEAIPYTRHDFFRAKLNDPRVFDRLPIIVDGAGGKKSGGHSETAHGSIERYDQKIKAPGDKLKMPNFYLTEAEIELVTQFLMGLREDGIDATMKRSLNADEEVLELASRLITERNCTGCHQIGQLSRPIVPDEDNVTANAWMAQPFWVFGPQGKHEALPTGAFLSDEIYDPWEDEDTDTLEFLQAHPPAPPVVVYGLGEGGIGKFIDQAAMRPPILRLEGAKVNPDWLFSFLLQPYTVRTHVNVRMPTFGFNESQALWLARWFSDRANQPWPFQMDSDAALNQEMLDKGQQLFTKNQCASCHPAGGKDPPNPDKANWGPDLALAQKRLKGQWIHDWLKNPPSFQPGTKMPSFFGEMKDGKYDVFVKDWDEQARALQHYLKHMDKAKAEEKPVSLGDR